VAGSLAECGEPLCCRNNSWYANDMDKSESAGFWGDYRNCDIPVWTVENMFEHISKHEKVISFAIILSFFVLGEISLKI